MIGLVVVFLDKIKKLRNNFFILHVLELPKKIPVKHFRPRWYPGAISGRFLTIFSHRKSCVSTSGVYSIIVDAIGA